MNARRPRKRFGQHFLQDSGVIRDIVGSFAPRAGETVVEIGPGKGALTRELLKSVAPLHVVELDRDLAAELRGIFAPERVIVHQADAMIFNFCALAGPQKKLRLIGNLPYNISTPLLFHLLEQAGCIADMTFMLQKEVVSRLAAVPGTKDYGRLSVMIQYRLGVEPLFDVPPRAFYPAPKVNSTVVRLTPRAAPAVRVHSEDDFARVVRAAFAHRRKTLRNNLRTLLTHKRLETLGIDPQRRAETLTLEQFARIADALLDTEGSDTV